VDKPPASAPTGNARRKEIGQWVGKIVDHERHRHDSPPSCRLASQIGILMPPARATAMSQTFNSFIGRKNPWLRHITASLLASGGHRMRQASRYSPE
jgi:hypothetical protein